RSGTYCGVLRGRVARGNATLAMAAIKDGPLLLRGAARSGCGWGGKPDVCARREPELLRGIAGVDGDRDEPGAVGECDDLTGWDRGEGLQIGHGQLAAPAAHHQRRAEPDAQLVGIGGGDGQLHVTEPV